MFKLLWPLGTVLVLSCAPAHTLPSLPRGLRITPEVVNGMSQIQTEFEVETAYCLLGFVQDGTIFVEHMSPAFVAFQSPSMVKFTPCRGMNVVGWFHNHPPDLDGTLHCYFRSAADLNTLNTGLSFYVGVLSCNRTTLVYRFKMDSDEYTILLDEFLPTRTTGVRWSPEHSLN